MSAELKILLAKLNPICKHAFNEAAGLSTVQTNYNVEVEHLLLKLLDLPGTDVIPVLRYYDVDSGELARQLTTAIENFPRGNTRTVAISTHIIRLLREAWLQSTLSLNSAAIRSAGILLALYDDDTLRMTIFESCPTLSKVPRNSLHESVRELIRKSSEER